MQQSMLAFQCSVLSGASLRSALYKAAVWPQISSLPIPEGMSARRHGALWQTCLFCLY